MTCLPPHAAPLEVWGGFECSFTRLQDGWRDQVRETGHADRPDDIDRAAALGITCLRAPFLWERVLQDGQDNRDWPWHDAQIKRLRGRGLQIVAGLVHHGSGPDGTDLLDPLFPDRLAVHAAHVANRYPDIAFWTPVNEPLTTARFSCLYGIWYPHLRDHAAFLRAVVIQCQATLRAMRAIRRHTPGASLLQTEDLGRTFSVESLQQQAGYENQRRWLSLDLLSGRVDRSHPLRAELDEAGVPASSLDELATGEARPDLVGANYYVTSERFLDNRVGLYPSGMHGSNGRQSYVDIEAVRVELPGNATGWLARLRELWVRYRIPIVISEVQLACKDEVEQARWFMQAWRAAEALRAEGGDVRAVTAWALGGAVDWDSLMSEQNDRNEPGAWDYRVDPPRPRLIAHVLEGLALGGCFEYPDLEGPGWWQRNDRFQANLATTAGHMPVGM